MSSLVFGSAKRAATTLTEGGGVLPSRSTLCAMRSPSLSNWVSRAAAKDTWPGVQSRPRSLATQLSRARRNPSDSKMPCHDVPSVDPVMQPFIALGEREIGLPGMAGEKSADLAVGFGHHACGSSR